LRTPPVVVRRVLELRWRKRLGPLQLAWPPGAASQPRQRRHERREAALSYGQPRRGI
jgi:hypothetical protein